MKLALIGTGNMGGAIAAALCRAVGGDRVYLFNRTCEKAERLGQVLGCHVSRSGGDCAADAEFVFLGVKPAGIPAVLAEIAPRLAKEAVIVSMAAGVTGAKMRDAIGGRGNPIVRILPNTPCAIGKGLVLLAPCGEVPQAALDALTKLLAPCGQTGFLTEADADAGMTVGGCTPAYTYMFINALAQGAENAGLPREDALRFAATAVAGAAELLLQSGKTPERLCQEVCSPGGSTIEGVNALREAHFEELTTAAFGKSFDKNCLMGK